MNIENRLIKVSFRLRESEYKTAKSHAENAAVSFSEYVRSCVLNRRVVCKTDIRVVAELRRLGGLVKHLHNESRGRYSELTAEALRELISCVGALERVIKRDSKNSA